MIYTIKTNIITPYEKYKWIQMFESKAKITQQKISDYNGDQKKLFKIVDPLLGRNKTTVCQNIVIQPHWLLP